MGQSKDRPCEALHLRLFPVTREAMEVGQEFEVGLPPPLTCTVRAQVSSPPATASHHPGNAFPDTPSLGTLPGKEDYL